MVILYWIKLGISVEIVVVHLHFYFAVLTQNAVNKVMEVDQCEYNHLKDRLHSTFNIQNNRWLATSVYLVLF